MFVGLKLSIKTVNYHIVASQIYQISQAVVARGLHLALAILRPFKSHNPNSAIQTYETKTLYFVDSAN
jgi:hypothetical protein